MKGKILDPRGVVWFLVATFALTYALDAGIVVLARTVPMAFEGGVAVSMFIPALVAALVYRFVSHREGPDLGLRFGPLKYYAWVWLIVPLMFAGAYAVTWLSGLGRLDPTLTYLVSLVRTMRLPVTGEGWAVIHNPIYIPIVLVASLTYAPFMNSIAAFGEELGWRGFLWPRLAPMGFWPASLLLGVIWGLWHAPIVAFLGFNYPGQPVLGVVWMCMLTTLLGAWLNWLRSKTGSSLIAAWAHGVFNSQAYGAWRALTWPVNDLVGGFTGVVGLAFLAIPAIWLAATGRVTVVEEARSA